MPIWTRRYGSVLAVWLRQSVGVVALACGLWTVLPSLDLARAAESLSAEACFTPGEDCTERLVRLLDGAQREILVQAYSFTSAPIAKALRDAHRRGVAIIVLLDKSQRTERYSSADFLAHAGIPVFIDAAHAIAHNKVMLIDGATLVTGSFNFTKAAQERNAENLLVLRGDAGLLRRYRENIETHKAHAERYEGR